MRMNSVNRIYGSATSRIAAGMAVVCALAVAGCAVPRYIWPQKDVNSRKVVGAAQAPCILIASRSSAYKEALVAELTDGFKRSGMNVTVTGLGSLARENAADYTAVVLINTCMAWGMDRKVDAFLDANPDRRNIIVYTTAGDPEWVPKMKGRHFDAISGASVMAEVETKALEIASKVNARADFSDD